MQTLIDEVNNGEDVKVILFNGKSSWNTFVMIPILVWTLNDQVYAQSHFYSVGMSIQVTGKSDYPEDTLRIIKIDTTGQAKQSNYYVDGGSPMTELFNSRGAKWYTRGNGRGNAATTQEEFMISHESFNSNKIDSNNLQTMICVLSFGTLMSSIVAIVAIIAAWRMNGNANNEGKVNSATIHTPLMNAYE